MYKITFKERDKCFVDNSKEVSEPKNNVHSILRHKMLKYLDKAIIDIKEKGPEKFNEDFCEGVVMALETIRTYVRQQIA